MSLKDRLEARLQRTHGRGLDDRGQLGLQTIIAGFILVVAGVALVYVLDVFDNSIGTPTDTGLSESQDSMFSGFEALSGLIEPILVIAGVVVILGLIRRVQS